VQLAGKGVYPGALTIGALIDKSDAQQAYDSNPELAQSLKIERVDPADLAERYCATWAGLRATTRSRTMAWSTRWENSS
jgi:hypothetical protein